jgi:hypothetical protein
MINGVLNFNPDDFNDGQNLLKETCEIFNNENLKIFGGFRGSYDNLILRNFGLKKNIRYIYDIGLLAKELLIINKQINTNKKIISINLASITSLNSYYSFGDVNYNFEKINDVIFEFILYLIDNDYFITFIPFGANEVHLHKTLYSKILNFYENKKSNLENNIFFLEKFDINLILNIINESYCVIGTRLHSNIIASGLNIPFIMLAYEFKCLNFANSVDMSDYIIITHAEKINHNMFIDKLNEININYNDIKNNLKKHVIRAKNIFFEEFKKMFFEYFKNCDDLFELSKEIKINWNHTDSPYYMSIVLNFH